MNQFLASLIVIFFPGIVAALIVDRITFHKEWDIFKFSIRAFVLGILSYGFLQLVFWILDIYKHGVCSEEPFSYLDVWRMFAKENPEIPFGEIFWGFFTSIAVAFIVSAIVHRKLLNKIAKYFNITNVYGSESLFTYFLNLNYVSWVYVRDQELNLCYRGKLSFFNEFGDIQEILLDDVTVYTNNEGKECYRTETLYLCKKSGILSIEIPKNEEPPACDDKKNKCN